MSNEAEAQSALQMEGVYLSETSIPPDLIAAYNSTQYRVMRAHRPFDLTIGQRSAELASLYERQGVASAIFITSDNPFSLIASDRANKDSRSLLGADLRELSLVIFEGEGESADGDWPAEQGYLALGIARAQACLLGEKYGQNAIVWVDENAVPELILLR